MWGKSRSRRCSYISQPAGFSSTETRRSLHPYEASFLGRNTHLHPLSPGQSRQKRQSDEATNRQRHTNTHIHTHIYICDLSLSLPSPVVRHSGHVKFKVKRICQTCLITLFMGWNTVSYNEMFCTVPSDIVHSMTASLLCPQVGGCHTPLWWMQNGQLSIDNNHTHN